MDTGEADLLERARAMDECALSGIYEELSPRLYRYACRLLGDAVEAEELVADTFHRFLLALSRGQGPRDHLSAYLYRVLHNAVTDRFRRRPPAALGDDDWPDSDAGDPAGAGDAHLLQARARALLQRLTPEQRLVITLKYFEGLENDEVAAALEKPVGAVKALQHRGLEALRRMLAREGWSLEEAGAAV